MVRCVRNRLNPFVNRWFVVPNDTGVGGYAIATVDAPVSQIDRAGGADLIADLIRDQAVAVYIVEMHNVAIGAAGG